MKAFAYLDLDGNLGVKNHDYITTDNPHFWRDNEGYIVKIWPFDTSDLSGMRHMLLQFKAFALKQHVVDAFLATIDFDISLLKANARKVQSG